jgi:hypothetical protein
MAVLFNKMTEWDFSEIPSFNRDINLDQFSAVGFEVITAAFTKNFMFWDVTPCSPLSASCQFLAWLTLRPWRWKWHIPPERWLTFSELHSVNFLKIELFFFLLDSIGSFIIFLDWMCVQLPFHWIYLEATYSFKYTCMNNMRRLFQNIQYMSKRLLM